jgi:hypothetical protein
MKMHSPGHSSADSMTASSWPSGISASLRRPGVALRRGEDLVAFLHVRQPVVEQREHVGGDLFAETVAGAEILIDPDLHGGLLLARSGYRDGGAVLRALYTAKPV